MGTPRRLPRRVGGVSVTLYQSIEVMGQPRASKDVDMQARIVMMLEFYVIKAPSDTFLQEIVTILVNANVGVYGEDLLASSQSTIPIDGTYCLLKETGGLPPIKTHNAIAGPAYHRPAATLYVHASDQATAWQRINAAYAALVVVKNQDVAATP